MCSLARRKEAIASRISGCGSAGVAAAGVAGSAFAAGVEGRFALCGAAGVEEKNAKARNRDSTARRPTILTFMNHSSLSDFSARTTVICPFPVGLTSPITTLESDRHAAWKRTRFSGGGFLSSSCFKASSVAPKRIICAMPRKSEYPCFRSRACHEDRKRPTRPRGIAFGNGPFA